MILAAIFALVLLLWDIRCACRRSARALDFLARAKSEDREGLTPPTP